MVKGRRTTEAGVGMRARVSEERLIRGAARWRVGSGGIEAAGEERGRCGIVRGCRWDVGVPLGASG